MDRFRSHKVVEAGYVAQIHAANDDGTVDVDVYAGGDMPDVEAALETIEVPAERAPVFLAVDMERDAGVLIRYSDGYLSWSPTKAFEEGYAALDDGEPSVRANWDKNAAAFPSGTTTQLVQVPLDYEDNRVTPERLEALVAGEEYLRTDANTLTVCVLTLRNGYTVTGQSACADPANYDRELGESIARENAIRAIWPLEGYLLHELLWQRSAAA